MSLRKDLAALDANVAFDAAYKIGSEREHYSCHALRNVVDSAYSLRKSVYEVVYERWIIRVGYGWLPKWWNTGTWHDDVELYRIQREQALEDFGRAILKAQEPSFWDKLKKWLASPCEYGAYS